MPLSSMHLLLLHPSTLLYSGQKKFSPLNQFLQKDEMKTDEVLFNNGVESISDNEDPLLLNVLHKLVKRGCKLFVRNVALRRQTGKKRAVHCDLIGYNAKKNVIFMICYAQSKANMKKTWTHCGKVENILAQITQKNTKLVPIVVPMYIFRQTRRVYFRNPPIVCK